MTEPADRFLVHPAARIFTAEGEIDWHRPDEVDKAQTVPPRPLAHALRTVLSAAQRGVSFRIGGEQSIPLKGARCWTFQCQTGGSTGTPKVIERSHASWVHSFRINQQRFAITPGAGVAVLGRLDHSLALYGVMEGAYSGADVHVLDGMRPDRQATHLLSCGTSVLYTTPTQLRQLLAGPENPVLRHILCGGGALNAATQAQVAATFPKAEVHVFYGASETSFITLGDRTTPVGSVGQAYPGVEIDVRKKSAADHDGVVWVRSPYVFDRYPSGPSVQTQAQGGWITVGETGYLDDDGFLWLTGRQSRQVTIADRSVAPEPVEALLEPLAVDRTCVVVPVPDAQRGTCFVIVWSGGEDRALAEASLRRARRHLDAILAPRRVFFHPDMPLGAGGKPDLAGITSWAEAQI